MAGNEKIEERVPGVKKILAYVRVENKASIRAFTKAGYSIIKNTTVAAENDAVVMEYKFKKR
jgi:RimJ/RimL family protein N-acetyltransferase